MIENMSSELAFSEVVTDFVTLSCDLGQIRASLSLRLLKCEIKTTVVFTMKSYCKTLIVLPI